MKGGADIYEFDEPVSMPEGGTVMFHTDGRKVSTLFYDPNGDLIAEKVVEIPYPLMKWDALRLVALSPGTVVKDLRTWPPRTSGVWSTFPWVAVG